MSDRKLWFAGGSLLLLLSFTVPCRAEDEPKLGLAVGEQVPISSMRCVVGEPQNRNTCLAGKYRAYTAISIYARTIDEPQLSALMKELDAVLAGQEKWRGYLLLLDGDQFDDGLKTRVRDWAKEQKLSRLDIAIANGNPAGFNLTEQQSVVVVFSEERLVRFRHDFATGQLDEASIQQVVGQIKSFAP